MPVRFGLRIVLVLSLALLANCFDNDSPVSIDFNKPPPGPPGAATDSVPPSPVADAAFIYSASDNRLTLEWTAPRDDLPEEPVSQYEIRFATRSPFVWESALPVIDPPLPGAPGETARYRFITAHNGESLFCAIRCADEAGNLSPLGNVATLKVPGYSFVGTCWDFESGSPAANLQVTLIGSDTTVLVTNADGIFRHDDLPLGPLRVMISGQNGEAAWHDIDHTFDLMTHTEHPYPLIPIRFTIRNPQVTYLALFRAATEPCKGSSTVFLKWKKRPVEIYIPHWINSFSIDYRVNAVAAITQWMARTGLELFTIVDSPPDVGVIMHFKTREEMGSLIGITRHTFDPEGYPLRDDIEIVNEFGSEQNLYRILVHELGHTIRLCHLNFRDYIMYPGQPLPADISDDEVEIVRMHETLPSGIDMSIYVDASPE
jgi:hypothetical protein